MAVLSSRRLKCVLRVRPTAGTELFSLERRPAPAAEVAAASDPDPTQGPWVITPLGTKRGGSMVFDRLVEGTNADAFRPLEEALREFRSVAVLVIGASSTGKSHTVLGTEPKAAKTGAAVDPGLVARTVTLLGDLYPDEKITLSAYELDGQARRQVLCEEDLSSPPAVRSAIATIRKNVKTTPKAVTGGDASQMRSSSRACTHLELALQGGRVDIYDIPGKEYSLLPDRLKINAFYECLSRGLESLGRSDEVRVREDWYSEAERKFPAVLKIINRHVEADQTVTYGCIDLHGSKDTAQQTRSTLELARHLANVELPRPVLAAVDPPTIPLIEAPIDEVPSPPEPREWTGADEMREEMHRMQRRLEEGDKEMRGLKRRLAVLEGDKGPQNGLSPNKVARIGALAAHIRNLSGETPGAGASTGESSAIEGADEIEESTSDRQEHI